MSHYKCQKCGIAVLSTDKYCSYCQPNICTYCQVDLSEQFSHHINCCYYEAALLSAQTEDDRLTWIGNVINY